MRILITLAFLFVFSACNNQRVDRLSNARVCKEDRDPGAFSFSKSEKKQAEKLIEINSLPEGKMRARAINATIEIADQDERRITVSFAGANLNSANPGMVINCISGLGPNSKTEAPASLQVPINNINGEVLSQTVYIEFSSKKKEAEGRFAYTYVELNKPPTSENNEEKPVEPKPFSSFFDQEGDEFTFYQAKEGDDKDKVFYLHFQNKNKKTSGRIVLEIVPEEKKK